MNTPDTEWEKELTGNNGILMRSTIRLAGTGLFESKGAELDKYNEWHFEALKDLLSSRDTYWKERIEKQRIKQDAITDGAKEWKDGYNQALDTLLDNLK